MEVPLMLPSNLICDFSSYRIQAYTRPSLAYKFLRNALGDAAFKKALHVYMNRWHGKHPIPFDFFNSFMQATGQNLMWFFRPWFFGPGYADQAVKEVTADNKIVIENTGGLPMPVKVVCEYADGSKDTFTETTAVWDKGQDTISIQADANKTIKKVILGASDIPDVNMDNNVWSK